jgi:hypothetical protein
MADDMRNPEEKWVLGLICRKKAPLAQDVFTCIAMLLACGFYYADTYRLNFGFDILVCILLVATLAAFSFANGTFGRYGFPVALLLYIGIPQLYLGLFQDAFAEDGFGKASVYLFEALAQWPLKALQQTFGLQSLSLFSFSVVMIVEVLVCFTLGILTGQQKN